MSFRCPQPFRAHAKDLLEVQRYPERRPSPESPPERPYDIAGWTLPLQMGVRTITVVHPFEADFNETFRTLTSRRSVRGCV